MSSTQINATPNGTMDCHSLDKSLIRLVSPLLNNNCGACVDVTIKDAMGGEFVLNEVTSVDDLQIGIRRLNSFVRVDGPIELKVKLKQFGEEPLDFEVSTIIGKLHSLTTEADRPLDHSEPDFGPILFRANGSSLDLDNLYRGQSVFIICNGPSLRSIDLDVLRGRGIVTFGMNNGATYFQPQLWAATDSPSRMVQSIWSNPAIAKFVPLHNIGKRLWNSKSNSFSTARVGHCPNIIGAKLNDQFNPDAWLRERSVNWGISPYFGGPRSTLLFVLKICYVIGFRTVYLVGCDFNMSQSDPYCFSETCTTSFIANNNRFYRQLAQLFSLLLPHFKLASFRVFNTNPNSHLSVFPYLAFDEAVKQAKCGDECQTDGMYCRSFSTQVSART